MIFRTYSEHRRPAVFSLAHFINQLLVEFIFQLSLISFRMKFNVSRIYSLRLRYYSQNLSSIFDSTVTFISKFCFAAQS